jgi:hypothetical protein
MTRVIRIRVMKREKESKRNKGKTKGKIEKNQKGRKETALNNLRIQKFNRFTVTKRKI